MLFKNIQIEKSSKKIFHIISDDVGNAYKILSQWRVRQIETRYGPSQTGLRLVLVQAIEGKSV